MIHFTLFGIPCYIRPSFWVVMALLGGALNISSLQDLLPPALFVIAGFIAILSHELGHALVGKKLGGGEQTVVLEMLGGVTLSQGMQLNRIGRIAMITAGPLMTFLLGAVAYLITWNTAGDVLSANGIGMIDMLFQPWWAAAFYPNLLFFCYLIMIGLWWTILNLLPIFPLDGGQLLAQLVKSPKKVHMVGVITSILIAVAGYWYFNSYFLPVLMLFLAYTNYREYKNAPF